MTKSIESGGAFSHFRNNLDVRFKMRVAETITSFEGTENIKEAERLLLENPNAVLIGYANHTQHLNIEGFKKVAEKLKQKLSKFYVPVASSLLSGGQNQRKELVSFAKGLEPILNQRRTFFIPIARPADIKEIANRDERRRVIKETMQNKKILMDAVRSGNVGIFFFPEGTTEGGTFDESGKIKGMIQVSNNLFSETIDNAVASGTELIFLPIGMVDFHRVVRPRMDKAEKEVAEEFKNKFIPWRKHHKLARVIYGRPFALSEARAQGLNLQTVDATNSFMMKRIPVGEEYRGYYGDKAIM